MDRTRAKPCGTRGWHRRPHHRDHVADPYIRIILNNSPALDRFETAEAARNRLETNAWQLKSIPGEDASDELSSETIYSIRNISYLWNTCPYLAPTLEVQEIGPATHDLCHSHASIALRQGATVLAIGRLLGHADPQTTLKYTHPADAMIADAAEIVGRVLDGS